jgi:hypothetical protein
VVADLISIGAALLLVWVALVIAVMIAEPDKALLSGSGRA